MFHKKIFFNAAGRAETRTVSTRALHLRDFPLRGVGRGEDPTDGARLEDIATLKAYTDTQDGAVYTTLKDYIDGKIPPSPDPLRRSERMVLLDEHTAFYEIEPWDHVLTSTKCAPTTVLMPTCEKLKQGDNFFITGAGGVGGWQVALEDGQKVIMGRAETSVGRPGSVKSTTPATSVALLCVQADATHAVFVIRSATTELVFV